MPYKRKSTSPKDPLAGVVTVDKRIAIGQTVRRNYLGNTATSYRPEYVNIAKKIMRTGATTLELAKDLGVAQSTLFDWCRVHEDFALALRAGNDLADNRMELSLFEKGIGYKWTEKVKSKKLDENGCEVEEITEIDKQLPPDNSAMFFWLKNRRGHRWKDRHEVTVNHQMNIVTTNQLENLIATHTSDGEYIDVTDQNLLESSNGNERSAP